jgi:light-regulated signal transduction histidine kinase (bacteriophytochrome)
MRRESIDLSEVVRDVATERLRLEPERQVSFAIEDGVGARGDRTLIRTVVGNFVGNALKFTRSRPLDACIEFGLLKESMGTRTYFIRDNGVGFESNRNSEMFKAFRRLHGSNEFEGEGIGLAIVDRIISRHGGSVWAQGEVGAGATFYFTLGSEDSVG